MNDTYPIRDVPFSYDSPEYRKVFDFLVKMDMKNKRIIDVEFLGDVTRTEKGIVEIWFMQFCVTPEVEEEIFAKAMLRDN